MLVSGRVVTLTHTHPSSIHFLTHEKVFKLTSVPLVGDGTANSDAPPWPQGFSGGWKPPRRSSGPLNRDNILKGHLVHLLYLSIFLGDMYLYSFWENLTLQVSHTWKAGDFFHWWASGLHKVNRIRLVKQKYKLWQGSGNPTDTKYQYPHINVIFAQTTKPFLK